MKFSIFKIWALYFVGKLSFHREEKFQELPVFIKIIITPFLFFSLLFKMPSGMWWLYKNRKKINKEINRLYRLRLLGMIADLKLSMPDIDDESAAKWKICISYGMLSVVLNTLHPKFIEISEKLLSVGWFFNPYIKVHVSNQLGDDLFTDEHNIQILENKLKDIEEFVVGRFPERVEFLKKGFELHNKGDYISSIPVMITQIDGIFRALTKKELFSTNKNRKASVWLDDLEARDGRGMNHAILNPLRQEKYFGSNFEKALEFPSMISRNRILHGDDLSYHTRTNSYKVISLLFYICFFVYDAINKRDKTPNLNDLHDLLNYLKKKL